MDIITKLSAIISTLNSVEIKGEGNMDKLLGSIQALKDVRQNVEVLVSSIPPAPDSDPEEAENG